MWHLRTVTSPAGSPVKPSAIPSPMVCQLVAPGSSSEVNLHPLQSGALIPSHSNVNPDWRFSSGTPSDRLTIEARKTDPVAMALEYIMMKFL